MTDEDWTFLDATISALDDLSLEFNNEQVDDFGFEQVRGQTLPVRDDQVENNAGGFVFEVSDETRIRRFLILGTSGGSYYVDEMTLKKENVEDLIRIINEGHGDMILREIYAITKDNRAPKRDFAIYATALCARYKTKNWQALGKNMEKFDQYLAKLQKAAFNLIPHVCRISTDLFMFLNFAELISKEHQEKTGWGRIMRSAVANWYFKRSPKTLAMQLTKYKNRCGYTHRDALRLCHADPQSTNAGKNAAFYDYLFNYAVKGNLDKTFAERYSDDEVEKVQNSDVAKFLEAVLKVSKLTPDNDTECAQMIRDLQLVREHIPTELLNSVKVWEALLEQMPMIAMIRNLSKLSTLGLITGEKPENEKWVQKVVGDLTNEEKIKKVGVHPMSILLAKSVYEKGQGVRGKLEFKSNPVILDALEKAFILAFKNVQPTNKRFCLALDVSGSMSYSNVSGSVLTCLEAEIAMSMIPLRTEPKVECVAFSDELTVLPVRQDISFQDFKNQVMNMNFSSTDCSLPMVWAKNNNKKFDVFIVMTDNETYFGNVHPFEALKQYRQASGIKDAKLIVIAFTASKFTIADPTDPGMLDISGFDSATPELISQFILGRV